MCIYCGTTKYRKIYENHIGPIPREGNGRSYEIHHLDKNRANNSIGNLMALTIQEHYDIHFTQGDWGACLLIGRKMKYSQDILTELNKKHNNERVENGTHHLQSGKIQSDSSRKRSDAGTLGFQNPENLGKACAARDLVIRERVTAGTWNLQDNDFHLKAVKHQLSTGTHCSQIMKTCVHCGKTVDSANFSRSHGDKCFTLTGITKTTAKHPPRKMITCQVCQRTVDTSNFKRHNHGPQCIRTIE